MNRDHQELPPPGPPRLAAVLPGTRFQMNFPAEPARLARVRQALADWASQSGLAAADTEALVLAVNEAVANAIEHAYLEAPGEVSVSAAVHADGCVVVTVSDRGRWRPPPADPGWRGRGLPLIERLSQLARVRANETGTTVQMWWRRRQAASPAVSVDAIERADWA